MSKLHFKTWVENMSKTKTLWVCRGVPGSGKSYTAKQIQAEQGGVIFSTDEFWGTDPEEYRANWDRVAALGKTGPTLGHYHKLNFERAKEAMEQGVSPIIIDNTNTTQREMKPYVWAAVENDYHVEFVEPTSKWWQKISPMLQKKGANKKELFLAAKMLADKNEHGVPAEAIIRMLDRWHVNPKVEDFI